MTTIAFRDGVLAADSQMNDSGWNVGSVQKIRKLPDGTLLAFCGQLADGHKFAEAYERGSELPGVDGSVVVIPPRGPIKVFENGGFFELESDTFYAWGSGAPVALGAMHMGASAARAVQVASEVDSSTGGQVRSITNRPEPAVSELVYRVEPGPGAF